MKRRHVLTAATIFFSTHFASQQGHAAPFDKVRTAKNTGRFLPNPGYNAQDVLVENDIVYSIAHRMPEHDFSATAFSFEQGILWSHALPSALYLSLGIQKDGTILLHSLGYLKNQKQHVLAMRPDTGHIEIVGEVPEGPPLRHAGTSTFIRITNDGTAQAAQVSSSGIGVWNVGNLGRGRFRRSHVEPREPEAVVLVDSQTALLARVDLVARSSEAHTISAPQLSRSLDFYQNILKNHPPDKVAPEAEVVIAAGSDSGALYLLLSPYQSDGTADVLSVTDKGENLQSLQILLPDRFAFGNSMKLARIASDLGVLSSGGSYVLYNLR